jgi:peptidyl-prolyl cis-trans isomerase C
MQGSRMRSRTASAILVMMVLALAACGPEVKNATTTAGPAEEPGVLATVGSIAIRQSDLDHHLRENHGGRDDEATRREARDELIRRAQHAQAALDADLDQDPVVRAEFGRVLTNRYREKFLAPRLKEIAAQPVPESRLSELYQANESRFRANEKRQVAVLWLNPNGDPEQTRQYLEKLRSAREWVFSNDLKDRPEQGFSVLGVDHSEHQASRYKGGIVGWLESTGGPDPWSKAVAEIAFSLQQPGEVSQVITRPEGLFLVRYMAQQPAVIRPLESVARELEQSEKQRLRQELESDFQKTLDQKHPPR